RRVGVADGVEDAVGELDARQVFGARNGIPGAHRRAFREQAVRDHPARRLAHVVGVRLEGKSEQRYRRSAQRAEMLLQLLYDAPLLQLVHLPHYMQEHELVAGVAGQLLERGYVLGEAIGHDKAAGCDEAVRVRNFHRIHVTVERTAVDRRDAYPGRVVAPSVPGWGDPLRLAERLPDRHATGLGYQVEQ